MALKEWATFASIGEAFKAEKPRRVDFVLPAMGGV